MSTTTLPAGADERLEEGAAAATLWWTRVPELPGERLGVIGGFQAGEEAAAAAVLGRALERLRAEGCTLAVGPMDGSTWRRYRFVTDPGTEPPFFLEPWNPPEWPHWWRGAGFEPLAEYVSTVTADLRVRDPRLAAVAERMAAAGVRLRPIDPARFGEELARIHELSLVSFRENFLYTPLPQAEFVAQYRAVLPGVRPELVLLAEHAGGLVGYVFALPDREAEQRGAPPTFIVKTLAVLPSRSHAGLGALLLGEVHAAAERLGYERGIHALMHQSNRSRNLSAHYATPLRRYALLSRRLAPA